MTYRGTNVLVTGAAGFIGSHVVEALVRAGAKVRALVHYNSRGDLGALALAEASVLRKVAVIAGDVRDSGCVDDATRRCAVVLHLAALISIPYSYRNPRDAVETNVLGSVNVLEACRKHRVQRLVCTSSSEVYGTALTVPMSEAHPLQAQSPYAASKASADLLALSYHRSFGLPVVVLRPFNTYGPRQSARAVIPTIIHQLLRKDSLVLGSLFPERDFTYVLDTVQAFLLAGRAPKVEGQVIHVGSGRTIPVQRLVRAISRLLG
ncbi:MAG: SDR family NAD(P)-dependent oxidoreductase, partial [Chloroflexota bacterium]